MFWEFYPNWQVLGSFFPKKVKNDGILAISFRSSLGTKYLNNNNLFKLSFIYPYSGQLSCDAIRNLGSVILFNPPAFKYSILFYFVINGKMAAVAPAGISVWYSYKGWIWNKDSANHTSLF